MKFILVWMYGNCKLEECVGRLLLYVIFRWNVKMYKDKMNKW